MAFDILRIESSNHFLIKVYYIFRRNLVDDESRVRGHDGPGGVGDGNGRDNVLDDGCGDSISMSFNGRVGKVTTKPLRADDGGVQAGGPHYGGSGDVGVAEGWCHGEETGTGNSHSGKEDGNL